MGYHIKTIAKGMLIGALSFILFCLFLEFVYGYIRHESVFARTVTDFEGRKDEIEVLFLGPSDVKRSIIPAAFDQKAFNFSNAGENSIETYHRLKYYIDDMPRLKVVVLPLSLATFSSFITDRIRPEYYKYGYITYADLWQLYNVKGAIILKQKFLSFFSAMQKEQMMPFLMYMDSLSRGVSFNSPTLIDGYARSNSVAVTKGFASDRARWHLEGSDVFDEDLLLYFEKTLRLCNAKGISVVLLSCPYRDDYLLYAGRYIDKDALHKKVLEDPGYSGLIYRHLDYLDLYADEHDLFREPDHLNHKGAVKFSRLVAEDISGMMEDLDKNQQH
ncbi:MAG: hypothetical protein HQ558_05780 [Candidatus Omnitrophica bacterium]|nr:hypothetical protein [Candidatus Omnitrophota bacterium]